MGKRILKIVAIVLASTIGFVGAVVGVMALMGKFKKPIVYPDRLSFADAELTIVDYGDDASHYFVLNGFANDGQEVNQKSCYLWFDNGVGEDLITFKDAKKQPNSEFYIVNCNEPIYYTVNKNAIENTENEFGKVVLRARDTRNRVSSSNTQTIFVDVAVKDVYLSKYFDKYVNLGDTKTQTINLNLNTDLIFEFGVNPANALNPIKDKGKKIVEIYYDVAPASDYLRVDDNFVNVTAQANNPYKFTITKNSDGNYVLKSGAENSSFTFIIAVFESYEAKDNFEQAINNSQNPNDYRTNNMVSTKVVVNIQNQDVDDVSISKPLNLTLYKNTQFTANGQLDGIGLTMTRDGKQVEDRINELNFNFLTDENLFINNGIEFTNDEQTIIFANNKVSLQGFQDYHQASYDYVISENKLTITNTNLSFVLNKGTVTIGNKEYFTLQVDNGGEFKCSTGAAFIENNTIVALKNGSYLEFFTQNENGIYAYADNFEHTTSTTNNGTLVFNVKAKNKVENLFIGALVVNNDGSLKTAFNSANINIADQPVAFKDGSTNLTLNINYLLEGDSYTTNYSNVMLNDVLMQNDSSYNAFVMITESTNTAICTVNGLKYKVGELEYSIVGYFEGNEFVNAIKVNPNNETDTTECNVYLLQLKNKCDQTELKYIYDILTNSNVYLVYSATSGLQTFTAKARLVLNERGLTISNVYKDGTEVDLLSNNQNLTDVYLDLSKAGTDERLTFNLTGVEYNEGALADLGQEIVLGGEQAGLYTDIYNNYISDPNGLGKLNVNLKYNFNSDFVKYAFNADNNYLSVDGNVVNIVENTNFTLTLTAIADDANIIDMLKKAKITEDDVKILVNGNEARPTNFTTNDVRYVDNNLVITFNVGSASTFNYYAIKITPKNANKDIVTNRINIIQDEPTDIVLKTEENEIALYNSLVEAQQGSNEIDVTISYLDNYTFTYAINSAPIEHTATDIFTSEHNINTQFGFVGKPAWANKTFDISYALVKNGSRIEFTAADFETKVSVGEYILEIKIENLTKYIKLNISASENFKLTKPANNTITSYESELQLSNYLTYSYEINDLSLQSLIDISTVTVNNFGLGECKIEQAGNKWDVKYQEATILTINKEDDDWSFTRMGYLNAPLNITITILVKTETSPVNISIMFSNPITVSLNPIYSGVVYQGTTVMLFETRTNTATPFENEALFRITDISAGGSSMSVEFTINNTIQPNGSTFKFDNLGEYKFKVTVNGTAIDTEYSVTALPNVVLTDVQTELLSNTNYGKEIASFKAYKTDITYGGGATTLYTSDNLEDIEPDGITLKLNEGEYGSSITTEWIEDVFATETATISVKYGTTELGSREVTIKNKYGISANEKVVEFTSLTEVENLFKVTAIDEEALSASLTAIESETENYTFVIKDNKITLKTILINSFNNVSLKFTFSVDGHTLIYHNQQDENITINLMRYEPDINANVEEAIMGNNYDIFAKIFKDPANLPEEVKSLLLTQVDKPEAIVNYNEIIGTGYSGGQLNTIDAKIAELQVKELSVTFTFELSFETESYTIQQTITIKNKQTIETTLPYKEGFEASQQMAYATEQDALNNTTTGSATQGNGMFVTTSTFSYEPVRLGQTITFDYDEILNLQRAVVTEGTTTNNNFSVEKVAYNNVTASQTYYEKHIKIVNHELTFENINAGESFNNGYFAFKLVSESGYVCYYFVRLQNTAAVDASISFKEVNVNTGSTTFGGVKGDNIGTFTNNETIKNNTNIYLLSATNLNEQTISLAVENNCILNDETKLPTDITNATKIKVALVYVATNNDISFMYGILNIYLYPSNMPTLNNPETNDAVNELINGVITGEYKADLTKDFANPFNSTPTNVEFENVSGAELTNENISIDGHTIVSLDGTTIKVLPYTSGKISFVAKYSFNDDLICKIHFDYNPNTLDLEPVYKDVGNFNNNRFDNTLDLSSYVGNFNEVSITEFTIDGVEYEDLNVGLSETVEKEDVTLEGKTLTFTQDYKDHLVTFKLQFGDAAQKSFNITVKSGIYVQLTPGANSGLADANTMQYVAELTNDYTSKQGSQITINEDETDYYICYIIGGMKIYVAKTEKSAETEASAEPKLQVDFANNENYHIVDESELTIYFAHTAETNVVVNLKFSVKVGEENCYEFNGVTQQNFYVKLPRTYTKLEAVYSVKDANHENVAANSTLSLSTLFGATNKEGAIYNSCRIALYKPSGNSEALVENYNLDAMGFLDSNNPNYISLNDFSYAAYSNGTITFNELRTPTNAVFSFANKFCSFNYIFRIMPNNVDDVNLLSSEQAYLFNGEDESGKYASLTIKDTDTSFETDEIKIGAWQDATNNVFHLTQAQYKKDTGGVTRIDNENIEKAQDSDIYKITTENYSLTFRFGEDKNIYIKFERTGENKFTTLQYTLALVGNGGEEVSLNIYLFNYTVSTTNTEGGADASTNLNITAGTTYDLSNNLFVKSNMGVLATDNISISLIKNESNYTYLDVTKQTFDGDTKYTLLNDINNTTTELKFNSVSKNATLVLKYLIKLNNKTLGVLTYNINLSSNLQFRVNGAIVNSYEQSHSLSYILTGAGDFPRSDALTTGSSTLYGEYDSDINVGVYTLNGNLISSSLKFELKETYRGVSVDGVNLKFDNDFNGTLKLVAKYRTGAGDDFSLDLDVNVLGFINFENDNSNHIITNSSEGFNAGDEVKIISNSRMSNDAANSAIFATTSASLLSNGYPINEDITYNIEYVITEYRQSIDAKTLFGEGNRASITPLTSGVDNLSVSLPLSSLNRYLVIFKIAATYLNQTSQEYYANYLVINNNSITLRDNANSVNVDDLSDNNLPLFAYTQTYNFNLSGAFTGTAYYNGTNIVMDISGATESAYNGQWTSSDGKTFTNSNYNLVIIDSSNFTINGDAGTYTLTENRGNSTTFVHTFNSLALFKEFIRNSFVEFSDMDNYAASEDNSIYYSLQHIGNGIFGINLTTPFSDSGRQTSISLSADKPLFKNSLAFNMAVKSASNSIVQTEFNFAIESAITPKGKYKLSEIYSTGVGEYANCEVVGIYSGEFNVETALSWVNNANSASESELELNGYSLVKINYSGTSESINNLYSIEVTYYAIKADQNFVIIANYEAYGESSYFAVQYPGDGRAATFDLTNKIVRFFNDEDGTFKKENIISDITVSDATFADMKITVSSSDLEAYKTEHQGATSMDKTYEITYSNITLTINVRYYLQ